MNTQIRNKRQKEVLNALLNTEHKYKLFTAPMRFGKSKVILDYIKNKNFKSVLIIAPKKAIFDSWLNEIKKWGLENKLDVEFRTYVKEDKELKEYDIVVLDEIHNITEGFLNRIRIKAKEYIGLTATLPTEFEKQYLIFGVLKFKLVYEYTVKQAIEDGLYNNFVVKTYSIPMDYNSFWRYKQYKKGQEVYRAMYLWRKAKDKIELLTKLIKNLQGRIIIFAKNINVLELLEIPTIHSKNSKEKNKEIYEKFNNKEINIIGSINMVAEGVKFKDVDHIIFLSYDSKLRNFLQRVGRAMESNDFVVHILFFKNTVEEKWKNNLINELV